MSIDSAMTSRDEVLQAEATIRLLCEKLVESEDRRKAFTELTEFAQREQESLNAAAARIDAAVRSVESAGSAAVAEISSASDLHRVETRAFVADVIRELNAERQTLGQVVNQVRDTASAAHASVKEAYGEARSGFREGRDEFVASRRELLETATELRSAVLRLESDQHQFRIAIEASVRRLERVVYFGVIAGLVSIIVMAVMR